MLNFGIKNEKTLDFLRNDVKSVITYLYDKKESQCFYNKNGDSTLIRYFNEDGSIYLKHESTFQKGIKTGYINYDKFDNRESFGKFELDEQGQIISKYHDGELLEQYQYNDLSQIASVYYPATGAKDIYEYNHNNLVIKQLSVQDDSMFLGGPKNKLTTFENDHWGNIVEMKVYDHDSKQLLFTQKNQINNQGDVIEGIGLLGDGSVYLEIFYEYEYDKKNNWIVKQVTDKEGNIKSKTKREILYYS